MKVELVVSPVDGHSFSSCMLIISNSVALEASTQTLCFKRSNCLILLKVFSVMAVGSPTSAVCSSAFGTAILSVK